MRFRFITLAFFAAVLIGTGQCRYAAADSPTDFFKNPIYKGGDAPDPWMIYYRGSYYFTGTLDPEGGIWIWKASTISDLDHATKVKVWTAPAQGSGNHEIWAPELHHLKHRWYIYYTASDGADSTHRIYVLESRGDDPLGPYAPRGRVDPAFNSYAIDPSVFEGPAGKLYLLYTTGALRIAPMSSPLRVSGPGVTITGPTLPWEHGWVEGPEILKNGTQTFLIYSAGNASTPYYLLGLLTLKGTDPLNPSSWVKNPGPVFRPYVGPDGSVYDTGHCSFTVSPDGTQDWLVYHGKDRTDGGFAGRTARVQPFLWQLNGTPRFGHPAPAGDPLMRPSGQSPVLPEISSSMPSDGANIPAAIFDGKSSDFFRSARPARKNDTLTIDFHRLIQVQTLKMGVHEEGAVHTNGVEFETSEDGVRFHRIAIRRAGDRLEVAPHGRSLRAVRIRVTKDMHGPLTFRGLQAQSNPAIEAYTAPVEITVDVSAAPQLARWAEATRWTMTRWYGPLSELLRSPGFAPPLRIRLTFRDFNGVAYTAGDEITAATRWFSDHPDDAGALVHEMIHVIQHYHFGNTPGWLVEGLDDYIRFYHYEPQYSPTRLPPDRVHFDNSYQTSASFLAFVTARYAPDLVTELNATLREGTYDDSFFQKVTGKTLPELNEEWKAALQSYLQEL